jgi:ribosomal protein S18 acetylase RimI-like enzyme
LSKIKKISPTQAKVLSELCKETFVIPHGHSAPKKEIERYLKNNFSEEQLKQELRCSDNEYHFIHYQNKIAGFSKILFNSQNENINAKNITQLSRLYLLEEFYNFGLGKALFDFNISLAQKNNQAGIWLAVWVENKRAISFYKKMGFKKIGTYNYKISESHSNPNYIFYLEI